MLKLKNEKGMTLVEIVVSLVILAMVVSFYCLFFLLSVIWTSRSNKNISTMATVRNVTDNAMINVPASVSASGDLDINDLDITVAPVDTTATILWGGTVGAAPSNSVIRVDVDATYNEHEYVMDYTGATDKGKDIGYKVYVIDESGGPIILCDCPDCECAVCECDDVDPCACTDCD